MQVNKIYKISLNFRSSLNFFNFHILAEKVILSDILIISRGKGPFLYIITQLLPLISRLHLALYQSFVLLDAYKYNRS